MVDSIIGYTGPDPDALVIGVPFGHGASFGQGAEAGPRAVFDCLDRQIELLERFTRTEPACMFKIGHELLDGVGGLSPERMVARVAERLAGERALVILVGGTHAVSIGAFQALSRRLDPSDITIVQIDAHLDLRDDDADYNEVDPSRFAHSCVMRRGHELGFRTCSVGIRAYSREEYDYAREHRLPVFEWGRCAEPDPAEILARVGTEKVYLTIDVDGFDPSVMPATGTPVPGGLSWAYGTELLRRLCREKEIVGADVVETAPNGVSGLTEYAAAQLCYELVSWVLLKREGRLVFA